LFVAITFFKNIEKKIEIEYFKKLKYFR